MVTSTDIASICSSCAVVAASALTQVSWHPLTTLFFYKIEDLVNCLTTHSIPLEDWRQSRLFSEYTQGETQLSITSDGELIRSVAVVAIDIFAESAEGVLYKIEELDQVSTRIENGETKVVETRKRSFDASLGGKMRPDEDPTEAIIREVWEELQIKIDRDALQEKGIAVRETNANSSYPGLKSRYLMHKFATHLPAGSYEMLLKRGFTETETKGVIKQTTTFGFQKV